jgi:hypothetical protein
VQSPSLHGSKAQASVSRLVRLLHSTQRMMKMCIRCIQHTPVLYNTDRVEFGVNAITVHILFSLPLKNV